MDSFNGKESKTHNQISREAGAILVDKMCEEINVNVIFQEIEREMRKSGVTPPRRTFYIK
jgi:hypothetical protein